MINFIINFLLLNIEKFKLTIEMDGFIYLFIIYLS